MDFFNRFREEAEKYRFNSIYANEIAGWEIGRPQDPVRYLMVVRPDTGRSARRWLRYRTSTILEKL